MHAQSMKLSGLDRVDSEDHPCVRHVRCSACFLITLSVSVEYMRPVTSRLPDLVGRHRVLVDKGSKLHLGPKERRCKMSS